MTAVLVTIVVVCLLGLSVLDARGTRLRREMLRQHERAVFWRAAFTEYLKADLARNHALKNTIAYDVQGVVDRLDAEDIAFKNGWR
jgi:hypothetical protein